MQISSNYTCITSLWSLPPFPHATRLGHRRAPDWPPRITQQLLASRLSDTGECADGDAAFCRRPPSPCPSVSTSPLSVWGSIPFLHVGSSVPLFSILYISSNSPLRLCFWHTQTHTRTLVLSRYSCPQAPGAAPRPHGSALSWFTPGQAEAGDESPAPSSSPGTDRSTLYTLELPAASLLGFLAPALNPLSSSSSLRNPWHLSLHLSGCLRGPCDRRGCQAGRAQWGLLLGPGLRAAHDPRRPTLRTSWARAPLLRSRSRCWLASLIQLTIWVITALQHALAALPQELPQAYWSSCRSPAPQCLPGFPHPLSGIP